MSVPATKAAKGMFRYSMRLVCFFVFGTAGMVSIGIVLLAEPVVGYYHDKGVIQTQESRVAELRELHAQQEELLGNMDNPYVIARAAEKTLKYRLPDTAEPGEAPARSWPELEEAIAQVDQPVAEKSSDRLRYYAELLAEQSQAKLLLLILGSALVVVSLTFFYRRR